MKNDWIIANLNNPDFTTADLKNIGGLNLENTLLLPKEQYLKSDKILQNPMFLNESGLFSESKFTDYYNELAQRFGDFLEDNNLDNYEYGFWDIFLKPTSRVRNPEFTIDKVANPTHLSTGIIGINLQGERTKSDLELAEKLKIFDWKEGKFKDESPEDSTLFGNPINFIKNLFSEPLVLAKYEDDVDEINPLTGMMEHHVKGENKLNSDGEYYFETLGERSLVGKNVLSIGDVLTKEDSAVNKYDFFDSDDLEKSVGGVIAKNLAAIAPMVFLGPVGTTIYGGAFVAREFVKTLPMLDRIGTVLSSDNGEENSMLNNLAAYGLKFTGGTSDYGKSKTFSFENFGNLISDVALQWGLLKAIAESIVKLSTNNKNLMKLAEGRALSEYLRRAPNILNQAYNGKLPLNQAQELTGLNTLEDLNKVISSGGWKLTLVGNKALEQSLSLVRDSYAKKLKLGLDLSLVYMSLISNTDVYDSAIEHGATKLEAAMVALGSIAGMFGVDKYLGLGEMFFDDAKAQQRRLYRKILKDHYDLDVAPVISSLALSPQAETKKGLMNFFKLGKEKTVEFLKNYHSDIKDRALGIVGKSIGEGLEETAEELNTDLWKSLYLLAGEFGWVSQQDIGAWDNARERYLMSFFGGAIGGGIFGGIEAIKNPKTVADNNSRESLLTIVRLEGSSKIIEELDRMRNEGKLGSKDLSINTQEISGEDGSKQKIFLKSDLNNISLNDFNYNQMKSAILLMDKIINANLLNISDDKLFERMITSDIRLDSLKDYLKDVSYISGYYLDFLKLVNDIYDVESKIEDLRDISDSSKKSETNNEDLEKLLARREELNLRKEDFFNNLTLRYLKKTMFAINPAISGLFLPVTFEDYVQKEYEKPLRFLSEEDKKTAKEKYDNWVKTKKIEDLDKAFESFEEMTKKVLPTLEELNLADIENWEKLRKQISENLPDFESPVFYDTKLEPKLVNIDERLKTLKVVRGQEYDRPWKDNPSRTNKAFRLSLEENPNLYFELIRDTDLETNEENGEWSIHFKTGNNKSTHTDLTDDQKLRLFEAASIVLPEGAKISTWGSLTRGGISGINRFGNFTGFRKVGERKVALKPGLRLVKVEFDNSVIPTLEEIKSEKSKEVQLPIIRDKSGVSQNIILNYSADDNDNINVGLSNNEAFLISKEVLPEDRRNNTENTDFYFDNLEDFGRVTNIYRLDGEWFTEISFSPKGDIDGEITETFKGLLVPELVPESLRGDAESYLTIGTTFNPELEITIPIWLKNTGETLEEYENRDKPMEGESDEDFQLRVLNRKKLLKELHADFIIQSILKLLDTNTVIDSNTFRYIMANLSARAKDLKRTFTDFISNRNFKLLERILDPLKVLNDNLDNIDDVWNLINAKIIEYTNEQFSLDPTYREVSRIKEYEGLKYHDRGFIYFQDLVNFIEDDKNWETNLGDTNGLIDLEDIIRNPYYEDKYINILNLVDDNLSSSRQALSAIDLVNIKRAIKGKTDVKLNNSYTITTKSGYTTTINSEELQNGEKDLEVLEAIIEDIELEYNPNSIVGYSETIFNEQLLKNLNDVKNDFDNAIGSLLRDSRYSTIAELLKKLLTKDNPTIKLLGSIASKLGENFGSIEDTLLTIYEQYDGLAEASDFVLSLSLIDALEKAKLLLDFAASSIIAASGEDSYASPWAYNKTINEWNREHRSEIDGEIIELPEISLDLANVSLGSIFLYLAEIDAWLKKAKGNRVNKVKMFKEFDTHFELVKLKFFMDNREKWITEDGENLLEGVEEKDNPKDLVLEYERTIYKNVLKLLKEGKNVQYIFDAFKDSINWQLAATQKTSKLDLNLKELSDYDKFIYIVTTIALSPDNFYTDYKKFVEKNKSSIAPLSFLKHAIRINKAHETNKELFNQFLNLFKAESELNDLILLENTIIITGIGGSGKTSVCAKAVINENTWVCGPTDTLVKNLKSLSSNLKGYTVKDLLKLILEDLYDGKNIKDGLVTTTNENSKGLNDGGRANISKLKINSFSNPPSNIILDESTLISNAELLVIAQWCKINNVLLILVGDENQNGNSSPGNNIARETTIAVRTPKMLLSLRDGNIWKYLNQQTLMNFEDLLRDTDTLEEMHVVRDRLINTDLKKFGLKYYFKDGVLSGDMLTSNVTDELIKAIPANISGLETSIKFIGSISSPIYLKLKAAGKNVEKVYSLEEILGEEADYIICDINWSDLTKFEGSSFKLLNFMRNLYTVITRSKQGSIIVDNGLSSIIKEGGSPQSYSTDSVIIDKESIKNFSESELNYLNNLTLNPEAEEVVKSRGLDDNAIIEPIIPDEKIDIKDNFKEIERDDSVIPTDISELPIQVYTNFNYLGINRKEDTGTWYNELDSHRDIGIFLRAGTEIDSDKEKRNYSNLLFDLKSFIVYDDIELYNEKASQELKRHFSKKNLKDIQYFVVKEKNDLLTHHLVSEELGLVEAPEGEEIVTLQARLKDRNGNDCIITLGVLPKSTNLHEEITVSALNKKINKLRETPGNEDQIGKLELLIVLLENGSAAEEYLRLLDEITSESSDINPELEIEKPDFTKICGLAKIRGKNEEGETTYFRIRLSDIGLNSDGKISNKSRFEARTSNYIVSPIYASMDKSDPNAGKPFIFVSSRRIYTPTELADRYEENISNGLHPDIRKIMLDPAGVSFESLFDLRYAETFVNKGLNTKSFSFPFDLLPMGIRMYTALHNFRANLRRFNEAVKNKFGDDLVTLEKLLKEESRLFLLYKEEQNSASEEWVPNETEFRNWLLSNEGLISDGVTLDLIKEIWNFNDNDLKNVKLFRLGYNLKLGVYVRNISDNYFGNYINPLVAKQYLGTVEKLFELVLDQIIPKNSINPNDLVDYRVTKEEFEKIEGNWVDNINNTGKVLLNIVDTDEDGNTTGVVPIAILHRDKIRALPVLLTMITKNLLARLRMDDPDKIFEGYDNPDNHSNYLLTLGNTPILYLKILDGGLGDIRKGRDIEPGVILLEEGLKNSDLRLINMFNVAFHGTVATGGNDFTKLVSHVHAKDVMFPYGIYVDPILMGRKDDNRKYRIIATDGKYYLTNIAPSGAKTFIKLIPKSSAKKQEQEEDENKEEDTLLELHLNLNSIVGLEIDMVGTATTPEQLIDKANGIILNDLSENKFSLTGRFNSVDEILDLTTSLTLSQSGTIIENKLKDFDELKDIDKFIDVKKQGEKYLLTDSSGKTYTVSFTNGAVKVTRNAQNINGFEWSIKDVIETYSELDTLDLKDKKAIENAIKNKTTKYKTEDAFRKALTAFLTDFSNKNNFAYTLLMEIIINEDELINKLINNCSI